MNTAFDLAKTAVPKWQQSLGWNESYSRRIRLITGLLGLALLFSGIVMQWWAGNNISDVPLGIVCQAYSGDSALMTPEDWMKAKLDYYSKNKVTARPLTLSTMAANYMGFDVGLDGRLDQFLYADPSMWCKYLPSCPPGATCKANMVIDPGTSGTWKGRLISPDPNWNMATGIGHDMTQRIRCADKTGVYGSMLSAIYTDLNGVWQLDPDTNGLWSSNTVATAANRFMVQCATAKGAEGYILGTGPVLSVLACLVSGLTLCNYFGGPSTTALAKGLGLLAMALTLVDFWVISYQASTQYLGSYMFCGGNIAPIVVDGYYFDGTPCLDLTSQGQQALNPYLYVTGTMTTVYTAGGVCNIIAIVLFIVSISKTIEVHKFLRFKTLAPSDEL